MKLRIFFSLALVLVGHCFAGIIYPQAPDGGRETVAKYLDAQLLKSLKVSSAKDLTVARPFDEYYVTNLTNLSLGNFLSAAKSGLWVYPLMQGTNAVGEMGLPTDKQSGTGLKFNYLKETISTNATLEGLHVAEQLP